MFLQTSERYKHGNITNKRKLWWVPVLYKKTFNNIDLFTNYWMFRKHFGITCSSFCFQNEMLSWRGFSRMEDWGGGTRGATGGFIVQLQCWVVSGRWILLCREIMATITRGKGKLLKILISFLCFHSIRPYLYLQHWFTDFSFLVILEALRSCQLVQPRTFN